ncbi:MAG TPA: DEAD/DEAH box helicase family protein [Clostridiaceae bacterium]|nr:DEAD/DEAH box helicase family protein [Clostridiaceae bacterium]
MNTEENIGYGDFDLTSNDDWEKLIDANLKNMIFEKLGLSAINKEEINDGSSTDNKLTICFVDFNIRSGDLMESRDLSNKNISQIQVARGRRFSLKVLNSRDIKQLKGIRVDKNTINSVGGAYSLFLEYVVSNGVFIDGLYYLGQMNIDVIFSLAMNLDEVFYGYPPEKIEITANIYKPEIRIILKTDGNYVLSLEEDISIIPGKYSNYVLKDNRIMKLPDMVPWSLISKLETKPVIGPEYHRQLIDDVIPVLKNAFRIKKLKELQQENIDGTDIRQREIRLVKENIKPEVNIYIKKDDENNIYILPLIKYGEYMSINPFDEKEIQRFATFLQTSSKINITQNIRNDNVIVQFNRDIYLEYDVYSVFDSEKYFAPSDGGELYITGDEALYFLFGNVIPSFPEDWKVFYDKNIEKPIYKKENVYCNFDFLVDTDNGLFEFDLEFHCGNLKISLDQLHDFIDQNIRYLRIDDKYVEITNIEEIEKVFTILNNFNAGKRKAYAGKLCNAFELNEYIENTNYFSYDNTDYRKLIEEAKNGKLQEEIKIPQKFKHVLRNYQVDGINWMYFLRKYGFGGILADDMGLGKTLQVLVFLATIPDKGPSLIVCPKTLIHNWYNEIEKFVPELKVLIACGGSGERIEKIKQAENYDVVITSYPLIQKDIDDYKKIRFEYCIIDEAQYIKNPATRTARCVKAIKSKYRLALTGTPIENSIFDLWSVFDFVMPGFLGNEHYFRATYGNTNQGLNSKENKALLENLSKKIKPFILRRTKEEILKDLPPKIEQIRWSELKTMQLALYTKMLEKIRGQIYDAVAIKGFGNSQIEILAGLTRLRQICNHPGLINDKFLEMKNVSGKLELFEELLDECIDGGHKILVFSQFVKMLDILGNLLKNKNIRYCRLDGQSNSREKIINNFNNDSKIKVFLISLKAGGFGLNLTSADTVILYDPWWNPMVEDQASDRAHRIGQNKVVNVYRLITKGTVEEKIQKLQERKRMLFDNVIGESGDFFKKLTWEDLKDILR